jgi:hypothetical protein
VKAMKTHALVIIGSGDFAVKSGLSEAEAIDAARVRSEAYPLEMVSVVSLIDGSTVQSFIPQQSTAANLGDRSVGR